MKLCCVIFVFSGSEEDILFFNLFYFLCVDYGVCLDLLFVCCNVVFGGDFLGDVFLIYGMEVVLEVLDDVVVLVVCKVCVSYEVLVDDVECDYLGWFIEFIGLLCSVMSQEGWLCDLLIMFKFFCQDLCNKFNLIEIVVFEFG